MKNVQRRSWYVILVCLFFNTIYPTESHNLHLFDSKFLAHDNISHHDIPVYSSLDEFDKHLPPTVTRLTNEFGSKIYVVGTAHFSKESQDDVSLVIRNVRPNVVMVELCASRVHILNHDEKMLLEEAKDMSFAKIKNIMASRNILNGLFHILMLNMSAKLTNDLGMAPGGEFRRAVEEMKKLSNPVLHLGDRAINVTIQRAFNGLSLWQTFKIIFKLIFSNKSITKEEVEQVGRNSIRIVNICKSTLTISYFNCFLFVQCKKKDFLEELLAQMADEFPVFRDVFVSERDLYLCHSLNIAALPQTMADGKPKPVHVVGVVGIGHLSGITDNWMKVNDEQIAKILSIPPASCSVRAFKFTVKYSFLCLLSYGIYKISKPTLTTIGNLVKFQ